MMIMAKKLELCTSKKAILKEWAKLKMESLRLWREASQLEEELRKSFDTREYYGEWENSFFVGESNTLVSVRVDSDTQNCRLTLDIVKEEAEVI